MLLIMINLIHLAFLIKNARKIQGVLQPSESKTEHDSPALSTVVSYTGHGGYFLFEITIQAPEATKLKSVTFFFFF